MPSLDRIDREILGALQKNARIPNKALADQVGLAPSSCLERVRRLVAERVVRGFHAEVDPAALGRTVQAIVAVRVRSQSRDVVDAFARAVLELPETVAVLNVSGADDFLVHVAVRDTHRLRDFVVDRIGSRPEVAHLETHLVFAYERRPVLEPLEG